MTTQLELTPLHLRDGIWQAQVVQSGTGVPQIDVLYLNEPLPDVRMDADEQDETWFLSVPIPIGAITDGVHTFIAVDKLTSEKIGHFTLIAGEPLDDDFRAEMDLLRAELDMLKRAFRRHCLETQ